MAENKPRKLTKEEIEDLVSVIGQGGEVSVSSPAKEASHVANEGLKKRLRRDLAKISITPLGLPDLKDKIIHYFLRSKVIPGTPVGFQVSESIGGPTTQMSLNSFKVAGSSITAETEQGIERIQQLIDLTKKPRNTVTTIHFSERYTYEEIFNIIRKDILEVTVGKLVSDYNIFSLQDIQEEDNWWYEFYTESYGKIPKADYVLRLELDIKNLVAFGVLMEDIAKGIEKSNPQTIKAVFSPINIGIIDIYPIEAVLLEKLEEGEQTMNMELIADNVSNIFLNTIIVSNLDKVYIKGIQGTKKAFPVSTPLLAILKDEILYPETENVWVLLFDADKIFTTGIKVEMFVELLDLLNIPNEVRGSLTVITESLTRPSAAIKEILGSENAPAKIVEAAEYHFIEVQGGKYSDLLSLDNVNPRLTVSNNIHDIYETLGIEAARKFYIGELYNLLITQNLYIDVRHITLMADFVSNVGILSAINATGIGRQNIGALAKSTYRRQMEVISKAAVSGELYKVKSVSAQVLLGKRPTIGTGYGTDYISLTPPTSAEPPKEINPASFSQSIDDLADIVFGTKQYPTNNQELEDVYEHGNLPPLTPTSHGTKLTIGPTPRLSPLQQIVSAPIVPNNLVEVEPIISQVPVYTRTNDVTIVAIEQPSLHQDISHGERNESLVERAETKLSNKLKLPSTGRRFTFSRTAPVIKEQPIPERNVEELLNNL